MRKQKMNVKTFNKIINDHTKINKQTTNKQKIPNQQAYLTLITLVASNQLR
jgi:hypothetical protein